MRIAVTGASGFIGTEVTRQLVARGHSVVGLSRSDAGAARITAAGGIVARGDVTDPSAVAKAVQSADAVVHLALLSATSAALDRDRVNLPGTRALLDAVRGRSLHSFVSASGAIGVYRHAPGGWVDESSVEDPQLPFTKDRVAVDNLIRQAHRDTGLPAVILRPPVAYGPGGVFRRYMIDLLRNRRFRVVGDGSYWSNWVHLDDVAAAYVAAVESPHAGETFLLVDDEPVPYRTFVDALAAAMGLPPPGTVAPFLARLVVGREPVELLQLSLRLRNGNAKDRLGWRPRFRTYRDGLPDVLRNLA